jgi:hypothetical protein
MFDRFNSVHVLSAICDDHPPMKTAMNGIDFSR